MSGDPCTWATRLVGGQRVPLQRNIALVFKKLYAVACVKKGIIDFSEPIEIFNVHLIFFRPYYHCENSQKS